VLDLVRSEGPKRGLHLALDKSQAWSPLAVADFSVFPSEMPCVGGGGFELLGSSVGDLEHNENYVSKRVTKISRMVDLLASINDVQLQYVLLKQSIGMPRLNYQLRVIAPERIKKAIVQFDDMMLSAIRELFGNCSLTEDDLERISFPRTHSGFGISLAASTASPAYVGSVFDSLDLQTRLLHFDTTVTLQNYYAPLLQPFNDVLAVDKQITPEKLLASYEPQNLLSSALVEVRLKAFIDSRVTPKDKAVVLACKEDSGAWLDVLPIPSLGLTLSSEEWRCAAKFRLGKPLFDHPMVCPCCKKGSVLDVYGIHATYCSGEGDLIMRHNMVRDVLVAAAREALMPVDSEKGFLLSSDVAGEKPADVLFYNWHLSKNLCVDVCVANSLQYVHVPRPFVAMEPLNDKENLKNANYFLKCAEKNLLFQPFVVGSLGGFNASALQIIKVVGKAMSRVQKVKPGVMIARLRQRISLAVQKAQAVSWIRRGCEGNVMLP
jgi:hypothetical protein